MESTHSKRDFFIVADDLGLDSAVNEGIFFAFKNGLIDGASLMANGKAFEDVINRLNDFPGVRIGAHLVLVEERPLARIKLPKNHKIFFFRYVLGLIRKNEIEKELEAQVQKILRAGIKPAFINSHQHLHLLPGIMDTTISLAKKYGIPYIRIVKEPLNSRGSLFRKAQLVFLNFLSWLAKKKISKAGLRGNDYFVGFINAGNLSLDDLISARKLQSKFPDKLIELGSHPGFESTELVQKYSHWRYSWQKEIEVLKNSK